MKPQIALTPDQIQELRSLGLDCSDASMAWGWIQCENEKRLTLIAIDKGLSNAISPAYTLEDILCKVVMKIDWVPRIDKPMKWVSYWFDKHLYADTLLDAAFVMLKYVVKNHPDKIKKLER